MFRLIVPIAVVHLATLIGTTSPALAACDDFSDLGSIHLEYNQTDDDAEAVIVVDAGTDLRDVVAIAPGKRKNDGKRVLNVASRDGQKLGITKFTIETPEPSLDEVKAAYPEGTYRFRAHRMDGSCLSGEATLSHQLLAAPVITYPQGGDQNVPPANFVLAWNAVPGAVAYAVEVEQEDLQIVLKSDVLATGTTFAVPSTWFLPSLDYVAVVIAIGANGNHTVSEARFRTAAN